MVQKAIGQKGSESFDNHEIFTGLYYKQKPLLVRNLENYKEDKIVEKKVGSNYYNSEKKA